MRALRGAAVDELTVAGAVGVSLFVLGLEIPFSSKSAHLSYKTLFEKSHLPLLAASLGPAVLLSSSGRLSCLERIPKKPTKHPLYIPLFCFAVAGVFWLVVATCKDTSMKKLVSAGWLFSVENRSTQATAAAEWDYWALFNFKKVEWYALSAGIRDIILLVLIGALSLPIFASEAFLERGKSDNSMNHEFVGHGISNTIAGAIGTLPNLFVGIPASPKRDHHLCYLGAFELSILLSCHRPPPRSRVGCASHACILLFFIPRPALCTDHTGLGSCALRWHRADAGSVVGFHSVTY